MDDPRMLNSDSSNMKWFASAGEFPPHLYQQYLQTLATVPHKVDVLVQSGELSDEVLADLVQRLSQHPKVACVIMYKLPTARQLILAAQAAMLGINLRFCDTDEEKRVLLSKRRSHVITVETSDKKVTDLYMNLGQNSYESPYSRPSLTQ